MTSTELPPNIAVLAAPALFGHLFNYGLFGVLSVQVYIYYASFPADPKYLKALIYGLFAIECAQVAVATSDAYAVFGAGYGNFEALTGVHLLWMTPIFSSIVSSSVQCFYAWRIYHLAEKSVYLSVLIVLVALTQGSGCMASGITVHLLGSSDAGIQRTRASTTVWLAGSLACDVLIAGSMLFFLSRKKQGLASDAMLSRIIRLTVETGVLTATIACIDLVLFLAFPTANYHFAPALVLSKLYSNSFMVLFNNRTSMRNLRGGVHTSGGRIWFQTTGSGEAESRMRGQSDTRLATQDISLTKLPGAVQCEISTVVEQDYHSDMRKTSAMSSESLA